MKPFSSNKDTLLYALPVNWKTLIVSLIFIINPAIPFAVLISSATDEFRVKRLKMVEGDIRGRGIRDRKVLDAMMTEALRLKPSDRVLAIGTGSGYQAAVLAEIVSEVYTMEIRKGLSEKSEKLLGKLGYKNIWVKYADGYNGWKEHA